MKLLNISLFLFVAFLFVTEIKAQSTPSAFMGNWMLDKKTTDTVKDFPEELRNYKMAVAGSESEFKVRSQVEGKVEVKFAGNGTRTPMTESASMLGSGASGVKEISSGSQKLNYGGTMALYFTVNNATYNLNGKEFKTESEQGPVRIKAKMDKSGKSLQFVTIRNMKTPKGEVEVTIRESWKLLDGDKSIKLYRTIETPTTRDEITMILNKVS